MFYHFLALKNEMAVLSNVRAMQVIMVRNITIVFVVDLGNKLQEFMEIDHVDQLIVLHDHCG